MKNRWLTKAKHVALISVLTLSACERSEKHADAETPAGINIRAAAFGDITLQSGLEFWHDSDVTGEFLMPEIMGSGVALFDYDNDEDLDIYLVNSGSLSADASKATNKLFEQAAPGKFVDATDKSGLGDSGYGMGTAVGDIDNDGDLDILVTNYGPDRLYRNEGGGRFVDMTERSGIDSDQWSTSAAFCDLDRDSWLDLVVATYVTNDPPRACTSNTGTIEYCGPKAYRGLVDRVFINNKDGTFSDATGKSGLGALPGRGLGVICFDLNADRWPDILIANDGEKNYLWINQKDGTFKESGVAFGVALNLFGQPEASMGIAFGDTNNDLALDLLMTHLDQETNTLYTSDVGEGLLDVTAAAGLGVASMPFTGFGTDFLDADHDGDLDLLVANGKVRRAQGQTSGAVPGSYATVELNAEYAETNLFFLNQGKGNFTESCALAGEFCEEVAISRGLITGDIDRDGDLDVLVSNNNGMARLYRNDFAKSGNWIGVRVILPTQRRAAVGARVKISADDQRWVRPVVHTRSYLSSGDADVHFGLGHINEVDEIHVTWPDGAMEVFPGSPANRLVQIEKGSGAPIVDDKDE